MVILSSQFIWVGLYQVINVVDDTTDILRQPELFICIWIEQIGIIPIGVAETNNNRSEIKKCSYEVWWDNNNWWNDEQESERG